MAAWIRMISDDEAGPKLCEALELARTPHGTVDNVMRVHSLRPNSMRGHVMLYRAALQDDDNTLPVWLQETIGSYVSLLNRCEYSYANHWTNARTLIGDEVRAELIREALRTGQLDLAFDGRELAVLEYAKKLTTSPGDVVENDVIRLRDSGLDDGQILEANQIIAYFNYVNRHLNGLGVTTSGDVIGYYTESSN